MTSDHTPAPSTTDGPLELRPALVPYVALVDFLGVMLGPDSEVLLHDPSDLTRSIVAIANSHVSGRSVGGPATDLVLRIWQSRQYIDNDYLANYASDSRTGRRMRSSTFFIRGEAREVIGLLCINIDTSRLLQARELIDQLLSVDRSGLVAPDEEASENLAVNLDELTSTRIQSVMETSGVDAERMSKDERIALIEQLNDSGIFLIKGAIAEVAAMLKISEPSAYRYLNIVRKNADAKRR